MLVTPRGSMTSGRGGQVGELTVVAWRLVYSKREREGVLRVSET